MIVPDVNLLVYAARNETDVHRVVRGFLEERLAQAEEVALLDAVLTSMIRVLSNPRIYANPIPITVLVQGAAILRHHPNVRVLPPSAAQWEAFERLCIDTPAAGDLVPDAYIASFAIAYGCEIASADRDFLRFAGVRVVNPLRV